MTLMKFLIDYCDYEADYAQFCVSDFERNNGLCLSDDDWSNILDYQVYYE